MSSKLFFQMQKLINNFDNDNDNIIIEEKTDECSHDYIIQNGYHTCQTCGSVNLDKYVFINRNNDDVGYKEDYPTTQIKKNQYDRIKYIRDDLLNHSILHQNTIDEEVYKKYFDKLLKAIPRKTIKEVLKDSDIDFNTFYAKLHNIQQTNLKHGQIYLICDLAKKFLNNNRDLHNINKRGLVYAISKIELNIDLSDYLVGLNPKIVSKYLDMYKKYKSKI